MGADVLGLKISLEGGGCAGFSYKIEIATRDNIDGCSASSFDGFVIYTDFAADLYLLGSRVDFKTSVLESKFVIENPNAIASCGCGESVSFG